jgi:hypothetical protein
MEASALPSNKTEPETSPIKDIDLGTSSAVAVSELPIIVPTILVAYTSFHLFVGEPKSLSLSVIGTKFLPANISAPLLLYHILIIT